MKKQKNSVLLRFTDAEFNILNDGWYLAIAQMGQPISRSAYIKMALYNMKTALEISGKREDQ